MDGEDAFVAIAPPAPLRPFVESLWVHRVAAPPPPDGRRLLPNGRASLVWVAGAGVRIAGPAQAAMFMLPMAEMLAFGATLHPGAVPYLLRTSASELVGAHVPLDAIDQRLATRIDDRLGDAADVRGGVQALQRELLRRLDDVVGPDPAVRAAVGLLDGARATVAGAAQRIHVSERELQRRFVRDVGYAPKTLQRVLRFQRFMQRLARPRTDLATAAALAGYADQSHLSREARRLSGLSPRELLGYRH
jgi:AraC-like DNA-binding protein